MKTYKSGTGETFFDVALGQYGSLDGGLLALLQDNPTAITDGGGFRQFQEAYNVSPQKIANAKVVNLFKNAPISSRLEAPFTVVDGDGDALTDDSGDTISNE